MGGTCRGTGTATGNWGEGAPRTRVPGETIRKVEQRRCGFSYKVGPKKISYKYYIGFQLKLMAIVSKLVLEPT